MKTFSPKEDVYTLLFGVSTGSAAHGIAIKTGLLRILAERLMDADAICQTLDIPGKRGHSWLPYLEAFGILEQNSRDMLQPNSHAPRSWIRGAGGTGNILSWMKARENGGSNAK